MKLISVVPKRAFRTRSQFPNIRINHRGYFWFSEKACEVLNIVPGMTLDLCFDGDKPKDWYFSILGPIRLWKYKKAVCFTNKELATQLLNSLGHAEGKSCSFRIATEPIQHEGRIFHALITTNPL